MLKSEARLKVDDFFLKSPFRNKAGKNISLLAGNCGGILIQAFLYKILKKRVHEKALEVSLKKLWNDLEDFNYLSSPSFCDGIAGLGWLLMYLKDIQVLDIEDDIFFAEFDALLAEQLKKKLDVHHWDQLHGGIGIALYFLKRKKYQMVELTINYLKDNVHQHADELMWATSPMSKELVKVYDLGLAHGNAGILYFLSKCFDKGILKEICLSLINGCLNFYMNNIQNVKEYGSFFCNSIACDLYPGKYVRQHSRLAWCYGDLGILHSLFLACTIIESGDKLKQVKKMLLQTTKRKSYEETITCDFGFCHGTAGIAVMYKNIYSMSKIRAFNQSYKYWEGETIKYINGDLLTESYGRKGKITFTLDEAKVDVLDGVSGIQLLFMVGLSPRVKDFKIIDQWKEILFLQ